LIMLGGLYYVNGYLKAVAKARAVIRP
jgi:hypothetical protein